MSRQGHGHTGKLWYHYRMCFSAESSIIAFVTGLIGSILCILLGSVTDRIIGYFLAFVSLMQGIEYLSWTHQKCDTYNRDISILGMILNHLQPIVLGGLLLALNPAIRYKNWMLLTMLLYLCVMIPYSMQFVYDRSKQCTLKNNDNHLVWNWNWMYNSKLAYGIFLATFCVLALLGLPTLMSGILFAITALVTFTTSLYFYPQDVTGAIWCYYSVFIPILYFIGRITLTKT